MRNFLNKDKYHNGKMVNDNERYENGVLVKDNMYS